MDSTSYTLYVRCGDERLGAVPVCVTRKRVRNLNLRVRGDGSVVASVPWRTSRARVQEFLDAHAGWIAERVSRKAERQAESREAAPSPAYALWGCEHHTADGHTPQPPSSTSCGAARSNARCPGSSRAWSRSWGRMRARGS